MSTDNILLPDFRESVDLVLNECRNALYAIRQEEVNELVNTILKSEKVFFVGVGRVMLSLQAITKRLSQLGIKAFYVGQITEPAITEKDLLVVGSGSGESLLPVAIAKKAKSFGAKIAYIGSNPSSSLRSMADIFIRIPVRTKLELQDEIHSNQPMTSVFDQSLLLLGDIIAIMIIQIKGINMRELWAYHANLE